MAFEKVDDFTIKQVKEETIVSEVRYEYDDLIAKKEKYIQKLADFTEYTNKNIAKLDAIIAEMETLGIKSKEKDKKDKDDEILEGLK